MYAIKLNFEYFDIKTTLSSELQIVHVTKNKSNYRYLATPIRMGINNSLLVALGLINRTISSHCEKFRPRSISVGLSRVDPSLQSPTKYLLAFDFIRKSFFSLENVGSYVACVTCHLRRFGNSLLSLLVFQTFSH